MGQLGHQFAAGGAARHVHVDAAQGFAPRFAAGAQPIQAGDAALGAGASGLYPFADPNLFLRQQLVGAGVDHRLLRQLLFFLRQVGRKITGVREQPPTVQLHNARRHPV